MSCSRFLIFLLSFALVISACTNSDKSSKTLFQLVDEVESGFRFENNLTYDQDFNVYKYRNFYNGGGVAIGDINNDGLVDIYMTANQDSNRLFLNKGNFEFEDITKTSGISGTKAWSTGVTMVDVNSDGLLDLYVCNSGDVKGDNKENELFINQGDLTFVEEASKYGLADRGYSTHASFFDYDKDGDLDVYLLNNSYQAIGSFNLRKNERPKRDTLGGDKLFENKDGLFVDVSEEAGIYGSVIGFGLGVTVGDVNNDGWEDIFVSNDFFERDYLYINQQDGTFSEELTNEMQSISGASMGADVADIDNDGNVDLFVTEMLPNDYERLKTVTTFESWNKYQYNVTHGYGHQFTRNTLHLNNGNNSFSEISRLAGVEASDWSWGALFFDMNNDGYKDLFIANGIYRDLTNQDYLQYVSNESVMKSIIAEEGVNYEELIEIIPSNPIPNHTYLNEGNHLFTAIDHSGLDHPSFSNGSAYGDLDNDGDLDLVVNNVNMPSFLYKNNTDSGANYIKLVLHGEGKNTFGIGAKVIVKTDSSMLYYENQPTRGFQSNVDFRPNIGLGKDEKVDVDIHWSSGKTTSLREVAANQIVEIHEKEARIKSTTDQVEKSQLFVENGTLDNITHEENNYSDFNQERLVYIMNSNLGPRVAMGDIDGDGQSDIVLPGPKGSPTQVFLNKGENYQLLANPELDKLYQEEHVQCILFDADRDGDQDLYLASGSVENTIYSDFYSDHILFNNGQGVFERRTNSDLLTEEKVSDGVVVNDDIDGDGDQDIFVGERVQVGNYGAECSGYILINDGDGNFHDQTEELAPDVRGIGMITDASFADLDADGDNDLIVVGEFMEVSVFLNTKGKLSKKAKISDDPLSGWWKRLHITDIDGDGDMDLIVGNHGLNSRFRASESHPMRMYFGDFDKNGFNEGVLTFTSKDDGKEYPYALRHDLLEQLKYLQKKYPDFESFKDQNIDEIFSEGELKDVSVLEVDQLQSILLVNDGNAHFTSYTLPQRAQFSGIYAITSGDYDDDGDMDLLLGGNTFRVKPEIGIFDATYGVYLENQGGHDFLSPSDGKGFFVKGEIRDILNQEEDIIVFRNNQTPVIFKRNQFDEK